MNIYITGRHVDVGDALTEHIYNTLEVFKKYNLNMISTNVILKKEKKEFLIEFLFNIKDNKTVVINQRDKDIYTAIDKASDKASKSLRRLSAKIKENRNNVSLRDIELIDSDEPEKEIEIIQMDLKLQKPLDIDEAIEKLKESKGSFLVFNDTLGTQRTIFEREDGNIGIF